MMNLQAAMIWGMYPATMNELRPDRTRKGTNREEVWRGAAKLIRFEAKDMVIGIPYYKGKAKGIL